MSMYICIHVYIYIYLHTYIHIHIGRSLNNYQHYILGFRSRAVLAYTPQNLFELLKPRPRYDINLSQPWNKKALGLLF